MTYAFPCIMTKASSGYHMRCTHFVRHILEGVWLLALPKADWDKICPGSSRVCPWTRLFSDDKSTVGWSLVKLALLLCCCTCFNQYMKAIMVHALLLSGKMALPVILYCLSPSSLWCPLSFLGFLGGATLFWVVRCFPIMLLGDRVFHILVTRDPLCELSLAR
jgi:hypothetical protein